MKKLILLFVPLYFVLFSCMNPVECPKLDYQKLGLDTCDINKTQYFVNTDDTLLFEVKEFYTINKEYSTPGIYSMDECENGVYVHYHCPQLQYDYNSYVIAIEGGLEVSFYSYDFSKDISGKNSLSDVNFQIENSVNSKILQFNVENAKLVSFRDYTGMLWVLAP